ncbi:MAG: hypothetical protein C0483_08705 [Pirellula sp.]|nr:hypothetical protein [Pirellula sp.]
MSEALTIDGEVTQPVRWSAADLAELAAEYQIADVATLDPKRAGQAVRLAGLLAAAGAKSEAQWLTLHSEVDDFHASIPLSEVLQRGVLIYRLDGGPLPAKAGGPFRFLIPDFAACKTDEIDECANVKFVNRIELTRERGQDNRPHDEAEHAALHEKQP